MDSKPPVGAEIYEKKDLPMYWADTIVQEYTHIHRVYTVHWGSALSDCLQTNKQTISRKKHKSAVKCSLFPERKVIVLWNAAYFQKDTWKYCELQPISRKKSESEMQPNSGKKSESAVKCSLFPERNMKVLWNATYFWKEKWKWCEMQPIFKKKSESAVKLSLFPERKVKVRWNAAHFHKEKWKCCEMQPISRGKKWKCCEMQPISRKKRESTDNWSNLFSERKVQTNQLKSFYVTNPFKLCDVSYFPYFSPS